VRAGGCLGGGKGEERGVRAAEGGAEHRAGVVCVCCCCFKDDDEKYLLEKSVIDYSVWVALDVLS
jgi:hypothetical protein